MIFWNILISYAIKLIFFLNYSNFKWNRVENETSFKIHININIWAGFYCKINSWNIFLINFNIKNISSRIQMMFFFKKINFSIFSESIFILNPTKYLFNALSMKSFHENQQRFFASFWASKFLIKLIKKALCSWTQTHWLFMMYFIIYFVCHHVHL